MKKHLTIIEYTLLKLISLVLKFLFDSFQISAKFIKQYIYSNFYFYQK